ncbi:MAG: hypothetical protein ABWZ74_06215, partial [Hyphomicrobiaceae bacterium]
MQIAMRAFIIAAVMVFGVSTSAFADIKAYNAAVQRGDIAAAATEAEAVWQTLDKTKPNTVVIARDFAFTAMRAGRTAAALVFARWLVTEAPA